MAGWKALVTARGLLAVFVGISFGGAALAQSPFGFLFGGGPPREGRSAYAPAPAYVPPPYAPSYNTGRPSYGYYSSSPANPEPYPNRYDRQPHRVRLGPIMDHAQARPERKLHPRPIAKKSSQPLAAKVTPEQDTPKQVLAAIKAVKPGKGPLGPFINDPTLRAGDVVVTTKGLMVYRGNETGHAHTANNFVSVARASDLLSKSDKKQLLALETANRRSPPQAVLAQVKRPDGSAPELASSDPPTQSTEQ